MRIGNCIVEIRRSYNSISLISTMRFSILVRQHHYLETRPRPQWVNPQAGFVFVQYSLKFTTCSHIHQNFLDDCIPGHSELTPSRFYFHAVIIFGFPWLDPWSIMQHPLTINLRSKDPESDHCKYGKWSIRSCIKTYNRMSQFHSYRCCCVSKIKGQFKKPLNL